MNLIGTLHRDDSSNARRIGAPEIVLIMGQSNAEGQGNTSNLTDGSITALYQDVLLRSWAANVSPYGVNYDVGPQALQPRPTFGGANMGPELTLGRYVNALRRNVHYCKQSVGNTNLAVHWLPTGTYPASGSGNLYNTTVTQAKAFAAQVGGAIKAIVWIQGEADAGDSTNASNYATNLTTLITAWRTVWSSIPVILAELNAVNGGSFVSTVRAAQVSVAGGGTGLSGVYLVNCDALPTTLHYTADQDAAMGKAPYLGPAVANILGLFLSPVASFTDLPSGLSVAFTDASTDSNYLTPGIATWSWHFGDGATSTLQDPSHTYAGNGTYTVQLDVTNNHGKTGHYQTNITISAPTWDIDATSNEPFPNGATQWAAFIGGNGLSIANPDHLRLCQEASSNLADSIGSQTLTASTAGSAPLYAQAISGRTRRGVGGSQVTSQKFDAAAAENGSTSSDFTWALVAPGTLDATVRGLLGVGNSFSDNGLSVYLNGSPAVNRIRLRGTGGLADTATTHNYNAPCMIGFKHDVTNNELVLYTPFEKITAVYAAGTSATHFGYGSIGGGTMAAVDIGYEATWRGANAEAFTDAVVRSMYSLWGVTVPW